MQVRKATLFVLLLSCLVLAMTSIASAGYTAVIAYGDSLSDNGNLFALTGNPPPPYYMGRFSNGPVTVEQLAASLHSQLIDFAYGGATTGLGNVVDGGTQTHKNFLPGMIPEIVATPSSVWAIAPTSLFVVWGGPNDFFQKPAGSGSVSIAVGDMLWIIGQIQAAGGTHILVPGMPDLSLTPAYYGDPNAQAFSLAFNQGLRASLPQGVAYFDTYGFLHKVVAHPSAYGFTDVTDPCLLVCTPSSDQSQYLFWDTVHPTTAADQILAEQFATAIPEPSTFLMLGTGISGLAGLLRRKLAA